MRKVKVIKAEEQILSAIESLSESFPVSTEEGELALEFIPKQPEEANRSYILRKDKDSATIEYTDITSAIRGLGTLLTKIEEDTFEVYESTPFKSVGIMLDCSRNAVMKVEHFKDWLRKLALLGYNLAMLYTEDTYKLPDEPYFGYHRGRYTPDELKEIDRYASSLGIEMIGCIQTLGHLSQVLRWAPYADVKDTESVLMVGEEKTYALIDKMISNFSSVYKSRRIHIGMDETHDLGRGRYLDLYGYKRGFDLFNEHLARVIEICKKYGLHPMIWSDMYFRLGSKTQEYYDDECVIPDDVKKTIPKDVDLVYWDYYHTDKEEYLKMIDKHFDIGFRPIMGSGVWTWSKLWYSKETTEATVIPCISACKEKHIDEIFFTMWGDDGGYCVFDSAFLGLTFSAERIYNDSPDDSLMRKRFSTICNVDYDLFASPSQLDYYEEDQKHYPKICGCSLLWDDPLYGIYHHELKLLDDTIWEKAQKHYSKLSEELFDSKGTREINHAYLLATLFAKKIELRSEFESAYNKKDTEKLKNVASKIDSVIDLYEKIDQSFRLLWMSTNKPFGLDTIQRRLASIIRRYKETRERIGEYINGKVSKIDELEDLPNIPTNGYFTTYRHVISGSVIQ